MRRRRISLKYCVAVLLWLAAVPFTRAQYRDWVEQQDNSDYYAIPRLKYVLTDVEDEQDTLHSSGAAFNQDISRLYVSPRLGIGWDNYIYHPYLLNFSMLFEPGYMWQERTANGHGTETDQLILDGTFRAKVLEVKPYATTLLYSQLHQEVKYGIFDSAIVDSQSWGASSGYRDGPVPVDVSFVQSHEDAQDINQNTLTDQSLINLHAHNDRERDNMTLLDYQFTQFDRTTKGPDYDFLNQNTYNYVSLADIEHFEKSQLRSSAQLNEVDSDGLSSTDGNANLSYTVTHGNGLNSYYDYSFSAFDQDNANSLQNYGVAGIQHQLFESLSSSLEVHGSQLSSSAPGSSFDSQSVGTTVTANYTKQLGSWGHLYLGNSSSYNITEQQVSGSQAQIDKESHIVPTNSIVRLNQPRDTALISVTDSNSVPLQAGLDYTLIQSTDPWEIRIDSLGPSKIQPGATIYITYTVESNPSGNYSIFGNQSQIRVTFFHDHMGVLARYTFTDCSASSHDLLLENDELFEGGADFNWHGLVLSADYIDEDATFYRNRSFNLTESYSRAVTANSTFGVDFLQQWNTTSSRAIGDMAALPEENSTFYNFMAHYEWRPFRTLSWNTEAGYQRSEGFGLDQNLFAVRTYIDWMLGKLQIHLGYEHEDQKFPRQSIGQDFVFLHARRDF